MVQATADYRRYLFFNPFTLAVRGLHFGRYGRDFAAFRDMYIGYPWFVRGYDPNDVERQCRQATQGTCQLELLSGQRIGVVNAELRFPLIRSLVLGVAPIGFPPIEGFLFADAGTAWGRTAAGLETSPVFERPGGQDPADRPIFTSIGMGARINVFGYLIVEVDYVNPLDRDRGWHWQFNFQPGF
jgi:outer membrane protein assembly factor BamA